MIDDQPEKLPQVPSMHLVPKGLVSTLLQCLNSAGGAAEGKLDSFSHFPAVAEILRDHPCICKLVLVSQINAPIWLSTQLTQAIVDGIFEQQSQKNNQNPL